MQNLKNNQFVVSQMSRIWLNLIRALKSLEMCTLIGAFRAKYIMFGLKKYRAVIFHDTSVSWKIWRKTDLCVGKRHEKFGKFSPVHLEVSTLMGFFCPKQKMHELKKYRGIVCNDPEEFQYIWRGMDLSFQKLTGGI